MNLTMKKIDLIKIRHLIAIAFNEIDLVGLDGDQEIAWEMTKVKEGLNEISYLIQEKSFERKSDFDSDSRLSILPY